MRTQGDCILFGDSLSVLSICLVAALLAGGSAYAQSIPIVPVVPASASDCEKLNDDIHSYLVELSSQYSECKLGGGKFEKTMLLSCPRPLAPAYAPLICFNKKAEFCIALTKYEGAVRRCINRVKKRTKRNVETQPKNLVKYKAVLGETAKELHRQSPGPDIAKQSFDSALDAIIDSHTHAMDLLLDALVEQ